MNANIRWRWVREGLSMLHTYSSPRAEPVARESNDEGNGARGGGISTTTVNARAIVHVCMLEKITQNAGAAWGSKGPRAADNTKPNKSLP